MKSIINWNIVNLRKKDKNLPEAGEFVVYLNSTLDYGGKYGKDQKGISTALVQKYITGNSLDEGFLFIDTAFRNCKIKTGFTWCYLKDIVNEGCDE